LPQNGLRHAAVLRGHGGLALGPRRYGRGVFGGVVVGDCGAGPIVPPGIIAPGFIGPPAFISSQHAIGAGALCPSDGPPPKLQLKKKPERKTAATINKPPVTMPTHASAWFRRLGRGWEFLDCSVATPGSSVDGEASLGLAMVEPPVRVWIGQCHATPPGEGWGRLEPDGHLGCVAHGGGRKE
jgi:hypothetical protein